MWAVYALSFDAQGVFIPCVQDIAKDELGGDDSDASAESESLQSPEMFGAQTLQMLRNDTRGRFSTPCGATVSNPPNSEPPRQRRVSAQEVYLPVSMARQGKSAHNPHTVFRSAHSAFSSPYLGRRALVRRVGRRIT